MADTLTVLTCRLHDQGFLKLLHYATMPPNQHRTKNGRIAKPPPGTSGGNRGRGRPRARAAQAPRGPRSRAPRRQPDLVAHLQLDANCDAIPARHPPVLENGDADTHEVTRICNEVHPVTTASLAFADHGGLATDEDTDIIALNLMDYMLKEENWHPTLSRNILSAACFFFACQLTGKHNTPQDIAASFEWGAEYYANAAVAMMNANSGGLQYADAWTTRRRVLESLKVRSEDVSVGYEILWRLKGGFGGLVGGYKRDLEVLHAPLGVERSGSIPSQAAAPMAKTYELTSGPTKVTRSADITQDPPAPGSSQAASISTDASPDKALRSLLMGARKKDPKEIRSSTKNIERSASLEDSKLVETAKSVTAIPGGKGGAASPKNSENGRAKKNEPNQRADTELEELDDVELDEFESSVADFEN